VSEAISKNAPAMHRGTASLALPKRRLFMVPVIRSDRKFLGDTLPAPASLFGYLGARRGRAGRPRVLLARFVPKDLQARFQFSRRELMLF
jgi:hypothetical protein